MSWFYVILFLLFVISKLLIFCLLYCGAKFEFKIDFRTPLSYSLFLKLLRIVNNYNMKLYP